jgi:predicted metalloendopeptidase
MGLMTAAACLAAPATAPGLGGHGLDLAALDPAVPPCRDFFQYANGAWLRDHPIPDDHSTWGAFNQMRERNRVILKEILDQAAGAGAPRGSLRRMVGDFYASAMDTRAIARAGVRPLRPALARIAAVRDRRSLARALAQAHLEGGGPGFGFQVGPDDERSTAAIAQFSQGGLGLPDRDYYLRADPKSLRLRAQYQAHVARMFALLGERPRRAKVHAAQVLALEARLAQASMSLVERRDPRAVYHRMGAADLARIAPGFPWDAYQAALGIREGTILVRQPEFFREFSALVRDLPLGQWRAYLRWHAVKDLASSLAPAFERESFAFYGTVLSGTPRLAPRWKRAQDAVDQALGEALGRLYVERTFPPEAKARALALVDNLREALRDRLRTLDWMGPATRAAAEAKLDALAVKIGYPDRWRDYAGLGVARGDYAGNVVRARVFESRRNLAKLGRPVDRGEWEMTPPTVNAYYNPLLNEIVFPAGILQPPMFDPEADDAVNYGAIGMVIGHELTHGYDDQGRQYDARGELRDWWSPEDAAAFAARTEPLVRRFDALEVLPGVALNGRLTLGENLADLGGLKLAFAAFRRSLGGRPRPGDLDGFTAEQRFFLGYAQAWRFHAREAVARLRAQVDPHAPPRFRVNVPLADLPEFTEAFGCGAGTPMRAPEETRPAIW